MSDVTPLRSLELVRMPQAFAAAPIFAPLRRGQKRGGMDVTLQVGRTELRVRAYEQLGIVDQDVLIALLRLGEFKEQTSVLGAVPVTEQGRALRSGLEVELWTGTKRPAGRVDKKRSARRPRPATVVPEDESLVIHTSVPEVARRAGKAVGGHGRQVISDVLDRLGGVQLRILDTETGGWVYAHLIHSIRYTSEGDRLRIALHPTLARVLLGASGATTRIDERDYLGLNGEVARRLLVRLCSWVNPGSTRSARLDTLALGVWPEPTPSAAATRQRRRQMALALAEIGHLDDWNVTITGQGPAATAQIARLDRSDRCQL